jgi:hypothetical protein
MPQDFKITAHPYCTERANSTSYLKTKSYVETDFTVFRNLRNIINLFYGISYTLPQ